MEQDQGGICINPTSVNEMSAATQKLFTNKDFREKCGFYNSITVKKYSIDNVSQLMKTIYKTQI